MQKQNKTLSQLQKMFRNYHWETKQRHKTKVGKFGIIGYISSGIIHDKEIEEEKMVSTW